MNKTKYPLSLKLRRHETNQTNTETVTVKESEEAAWLCLEGSKKTWVRGPSLAKAWRATRQKWEQHTRTQAGPSRNRYMLLGWSPEPVRQSTENEQG